MKATKRDDKERGALKAIENPVLTGANYKFETGASNNFEPNPEELVLSLYQYFQVCMTSIY